MNNVICWFEIYVQDMNRAKKFYNEVLGRTFTDMEMPGDADQSMKMATFNTANPSDMTAVCGALIEMPGVKDGEEKALGSIVYFPCNDCAVEESRVEKVGGKIITPKMSIGEHGFCSICIDTEGNSFGLYSMS